MTAEYHDVYFDYNLRPYNFAPWFSAKYLTQGATQEFALDAPNAASGGAMLTLNLWSLTSSDTADPDHSLLVTLNGQPAGQAQWDGGNKMIQLSFSLPQDLLNSGINTIGLTTPALPGVDAQTAFVHSMTLTYTRTLDASKPFQITNTENAARVYELGNATSANVWIVDTRYPDRATLAPVESLAAADGTFRLRFTAAGFGTYLIVPAGQENQPLSITKRQVKPVRSTGAYLRDRTQPILRRRAAVAHDANPRRNSRAICRSEELFDYSTTAASAPTESAKPSGRSARIICSCSAEPLTTIATTAA